MHSVRSDQGPFHPIVDSRLVGRSRTIVRRRIGWALIWILWFGLGTASAQAACPPCTTFATGASNGTVPAWALAEASGLAASARNAGVLWTHNDGGKDRKIYAISTTGSLLATFYLTNLVDDVEDIAVGPGPVAGVSYLYVGDIGGDVGTNTSRLTIRILRVAEPPVDLAWAANPPPLTSFADVATFTLEYLAGSYSAETLWLDPVSGDVLVVTRESPNARVFSANLNAATNGAILPLQYVATVGLNRATGGDISADGTQIALRSQGYAVLWTRCNSEPIGTALARSATIINVVGPPTEPQGEALAFLRDGTGYVTLSECTNEMQGECMNQPLYFFQALCPRAPMFTVTLTNQTVTVGSGVQFEALAVGYPRPTYQWRFNGQVRPQATNAALTLGAVTLADAGTYEITASNANGTATNAATLAVGPRLFSTRAGGKIRIEFDGVVGHRYILEARGDLAASSWLPTGDAVQATNNVRLMFEKEWTGECQYFRVEVQ